MSTDKFHDQYSYGYGGVIFTILLICLFIWGVTVLFETDPVRDAQIAAEKAAFIAALPTNDYITQESKKCVDAGLSVDRKTEYRYGNSHVLAVSCGEPLAQKAAREQAAADDSELMEAAAIGVGGYLIGKVLFD